MGRITSDLRADYAVNTRLLDRASVTVFRINQAAERSRFRLVLKPIAKVVDAVWLQLIIGAELPGTIRCGPGLRLPHAGRGIVLSGNCTIGSDVTIYHRVTLGQSDPDSQNVPSVGDGVSLGAGATVLGKVSLGAHARIGAGAVVTKNIPAFAVAVGVPARINADAQPQLRSASALPVEGRS